MENENHAIQNASGWSATITALVAALNCDFDRLEELQDARDALVHELEHAEGAAAIDDARQALTEWHASTDGDEWRELDSARTIDGDKMTDADSVRERIQESALEVSIRSDWYSPGDADSATPSEFRILLSTGGPALQIRGELGEHCEPRRAWLEYQDWGTPWTEYHGAGAAGAPSQDGLVQFANCFYFGG